MATQTLHVVPNNSEWAVKRAGTEEPTSKHATQEEAIDAAEGTANEGDNIVIHNSDGTIRENRTHRDSHTDQGTKLAPRDVMSVGTRVSWSAVFAGAVVGMAVYITLIFLAVAIGITTLDYLHSKTFAIGATVVSIFSCLVSLFVGGFVVSRTTAGENKLEALVYGVILWAVLLVVPSILTGTGIGVGLAGLTATSDKSSSEMLSANTVADGLELSEQQKQKYQEMVQEARNAVEGTSTVTLAWGGFATMVLSVLAAVGGSIAGAGPELVIQQMRNRRMAIRKA